MAAEHPLIACVGCGALVPDSSGATHRYIGASPGCWAIYGEVLAREYSDFRYVAAHHLTVDAYAAQHPGTPSPQSIQSVAVHLISLSLQLESGRQPPEVRAAMQRATTHRDQFVWLDPPPSLGAITVLDVLAVPDAESHCAIVRRWAESVWQAWAPHHATVRQWIAAYV
jgi:hypothetical protein